MLKGIKTKAVLISVSRIWWVKNPLKAAKTLHVIKIEVDIFYLNIWLNLLICPDPVLTQWRRYNPPIKQALNKIRYFISSIGLIFLNLFNRW